MSVCVRRNFVGHSSPACLHVLKTLLYAPHDLFTLPTAICNFEGDGPHRLPLRFGDVVSVLEECRGWYRGCLYHQPAQQVRSNDIYR